MLTPAGRATSIATLLLAVALEPPPALAADCNGNAVDDFVDVTRGDVSFLTRLATSESTTLTNTTALVAEDLDHDGRTDLAVLGALESTVSVLWGEGPGSFSKPSRFLLQKRCLALAAGDLTSDGTVDLAAGGPEGVVLLLQTGDRRAIPGFLPAASTRGALALADLDGDKDLDIAFAGAFDVFIFPGAADGNFEEPRRIPAGSGPIHLAAADVDGDGDVDIATVNSLAGSPAASVSVFLNRGDASFAPSRNYSAGTAPSSLSAGDLDGNGRADLVVTDSSTADFTVFRAEDGGRLAALPRLATGGDPLATALSDFDRDGDLDIVVSRAWDARDPIAGGAITLFWNQAPGTIRRGFDSRVGGRPVSFAVTDLFDGEAPEVAAVDLVTGDIHILTDTLVAHHEDCDGNFVPDVCDILTQDCNGNGLNDLCDVVALRSTDCNRNDIPDECEPDCNGNFLADDCDVSSRRSADCNQNEVPDECDIRRGSFRFDVTSIGAAILSMMALDLDGDGRPDLAGLDLSNRLVVSWNSGDGSLEPPDGVAPAAVDSPLAAGDLDSDGDLDLAAGDTGSKTIRILIQSEPRVFSPGIEIALEQVPGSIAAGELDGEGLLEVAVLDASGNILIFAGAGTGAARPLGNLASRAAPGFLSAQDIDGDGAGDLSCVLAGDAPAVFWNRGGASFGEPAPLPTTLSLRAPAIDDIDNDGDLDFVVAEGDGVFLFLQTDPRVFERSSLFRSSDLALLAVADADLDGLNDLIAAHDGVRSTGLEVWRGNGEGGFMNPHAISTPVGLAGISVIDIDQSGSPDIVAAFQDSPCPQCPPVGRVFLWRNLTLPPVSLDLDRNGRPDECDAGAFRRGDTDGDGALSLTDAVFTLLALFQGGPAPGCAEAADADNDGSVKITDPISVLDFLFRGGPPPAAPGPPPGPCGLDTDAPGSPASLGCADYGSC